MPAKAKNSLTFMTHPDVIARIAKSDVSFYLMLQHGWHVAKCAYAFHVNKNATEAISAEACLKIDFVDVQLNQAAFADGAKDEWICLFLRNLLNMDHLTIVSFHNSSGTVIDNAMTVLDERIFSPAIA